MCFISVTMKGLSLKKQGACPGHPHVTHPQKKGARPLLVTGPLQLYVKRRLPTLPPKGRGQPSTCITRTQKVRAISNARLWCLHLYTCILSTSWSVTALIIGYLILQMASCLDAFSTYPNQTWIPSNAPGGTTGKPEVCPTRSSRTSVRTAQISCAHDR